MQKKEETPEEKKNEFTRYFAKKKNSFFVAKKKKKKKKRKGNPTWLVRMVSFVFCIYVAALNFQRICFNCHRKKKKGKKIISEKQINQKNFSFSLMLLCMVCL